MSEVLHIACLRALRLNAARLERSLRQLLRVVQSCDIRVRPLSRFGASRSPQSLEPSTLRLLAGHGPPPQDTEPHV
ncbi:hypothetical protein EMIT0P253_20062 [Pseudomonas sp. IT-P253]